ncbi:hypothetical protein [Cohnella sp. 56]|uniref:hypothetical protein n=1 Tax=Cohnella sp. 56 TaxID=3113722 RepID=UPI0030EA4320
MKPINPDWYAELKGEPLRERHFTESLAASVRERAALPPAKSQTGRRLAVAGLTVAVAAASAICYDGLSSRPAQPGREADSVHAASPADGLSSAPLVSDNAQVAIGHGPAVSIKFGPNIEFPHNKLLERQAGTRARFEFWTVRHEDGSYLFGADYYDKEGEAQDWQLRGTASFTEQADEPGLSKGGLVSHSFGYDNYSVFAGQMLDPEAESVQLTDPRGSRVDATVVRNSDGRFWVAVVEGSPRDYTMQMLDRDGAPLGDPVR